MTYEILVKVNGRFEWLIASYELTAEQGKNLHMLGWSKINVDRATYENSIFFFFLARYQLTNLEIQAIPYSHIMAKSRILKKS